MLLSTVLLKDHCGVYRVFIGIVVKDKIRWKCKMSSTKKIDPKRVFICLRPKTAYPL
jgi:hypothetical protein